MLINESGEDYKREMASTPRFITHENKKEHDYAVKWRNLLKSEEKDLISLKEKYIDMKKSLLKEIKKDMLNDERNSLRDS